MRSHRRSRPRCWVSAFQQVFVHMTPGGGRVNSALGTTGTGDGGGLPFTHDGNAVAATHDAGGAGASHDGDSLAVQPPTIYDVARAAGVSIASVSRVLNGQRNPRRETKERVTRAVAELGFVPDSAARALSARLKEDVGVVVRRPRWPDGSMFADEDENLQFPDMINRGMEIVAQQHGFDLLIRSVDLDEPDAAQRIFALARKSDGLILHDRILSPDELDRLSRQIPVVTLAGEPTPATANVHGDNEGGMRALARHLIFDHGYRTLSYVAGRGQPGQPDPRPGARGRGGRGGRAPADGRTVARQLPGRGWVAGNRAAARGRGPDAAGDRVRKRPVRHRRAARARPARYPGAG